MPLTTAMQTLGIFVKFLHNTANGILKSHEVEQFGVSFRPCSRCGFVVSTIYHVFETLPVAFKNNTWSQKTRFFEKSWAFLINFASKKVDFEKY